MKGVLKFSAATGAALVLAACSEQAAETRAPAEREVRVLVQPLQLSPARTEVEAVGTSRAVRSVTVHPATSGEVVAVNFEPGQYVEQDEVLVELDQRDERLAVELAKVRLADAERLYDRYQRAGDSGAVVPTTLDEARSAVESARIELNRAQVALEYRTITAPFPGYVGVTEVDTGDRINPETEITTLDDRSALLVSFELPETLIGNLDVGDDVAIATWNSREPAGYGYVVDIGSRIDPASRTFVARARVDNEADTLRPGMSFRVNMTIEGRRYPVIPETGVQWGAEGAYIWTVVDGQARRVPVEIVQRQKGQVLVDADLAEGELVVVEGTQRMRSGIDVNWEPASLADSVLEGGQLLNPPGAAD